MRRLFEVRRLFADLRCECVCGGGGGGEACLYIHVKSNQYSKSFSNLDLSVSMPPNIFNHKSIPV